MSEERAPEPESGASAETYDHSGPRSGGIAMLASCFFFAGGQLVKGQFLRALVLWGILLGIVAILVLVATMMEPGSTARDVGLYATIGALIVLWLFQFWDAGWHS